MLSDRPSPFISARPTRGALVATLFAIITVVIVGAASLVDTDDQSVVETSADAADGQRSMVLARPLDEVADDAGARPAPGSDSGITEDNGDSAGTDEPSADFDGHVQYDLAMSELGVQDATAPAAEPIEEPPASPTTVQATTAPPTSAEGEETTTTGEGETTTTVADDTSSTTDTTTADGETTTTTEATTTTESTTTTAAGNGFVDAGHGVFVPPVLIEIRRCESTHNYTAANPSSSARGAYQFLRSSWAAYGHADRYGVSEAHLATPAQQDEAALITWQRDGTRPWNASRSCWS